MRHPFRSRPQLEVLEDRLPPGSLHGGQADVANPDVSALARAVGVASAPAISSHGNLNPGVFNIQSKPYVKTYGEWSAAFFQWQFSLPVDNNPLFDTADCSTGQSGHVWFLGGTFTVVETAPEVVIGEATRDCTVPAGTALFFPVINGEASTIEGNGTTEAELRAVAHSLVDHVTELSATVDGKAVQGLTGYRADSPLFTIGPLPENNILQAQGVDAPAGSTSPAVADGYYLMLKPLPVGQHTIHFTGTAVFTEANDGFNLTFKLDITYHITVAPHAP